MSSKKTKISRKDPLKSPKVWEKARREKMKIYFNELQEVLPFYDPSTPMSRFEILQKSKIFIKDLQDQNQDLLNGGFDEVYRNKMSKLKQRVTELLKRVDQLTDLLRAANIMIPPLEMYPEDLKSCSSFKWMNQRPKKWTEKINLVVPDEKIKSVLTLIKDYKKNSGKISLKKKQISKNIDKSKNVTSQPCLQRTGDKSKKMLKMNKKIINLKGVKSDKKYESSDSFNGSQSPSQFKENQPVDYNLLSVSNSAQSKGSGNNNDLTDNSSNSDNNKDNISDTNSSNNILNNNNNDRCSSTGSSITSSSSSSSSNNNNINANNNSNEASNNSKNKNSDHNISLSASKNQCNLDTRSAQIVTLQSSTNKVGVPQQLIEAQPNIVIPPAPNVLQSNTFILTNDGSLVQLPILNSLGTVFDGNSNLLTPATIVKPNAGLLTPIVINKPSPVIVLQKPTPQIIQTAQILNAAPQVISVSKSNVQILNSPIIYTSSNAVTGSRTLSHILSKAPANKKRIMRDSTTTTYVNKIPIAALSKHSYTKKNVSSDASGEKSKPADVKGKEVSEKQIEAEAKSNCVIQNEEQTTGKSIESKNEKTGSKAEDRKKGNYSEGEFVLEGGRKRNLEDEKLESSKKQKMKENLEGNFFKPIENPIEADGMFCNLALPNAINPSLSVSPTAAFLSSFPIVAPIRSEADDDTGDKKSDEGKETKQNEVHPSRLEQAIEGSSMNNERSKTLGSKEFLTESAENGLLAETNLKEKGNDLNDEQRKFINENPVNNNNNNFNVGISASRDNLNNANNNNNSANNAAVAVGVNTNNNKPNLAQQQQIDNCKTWGQYHHENCEIRPETFYMPTDNTIHIENSVASVDTASTTDMNFPGISTNMSNLPYKTYLPNSSAKTNSLGIQDTLNEQVSLKTNQFEYPQKENYMNQVPAYSTERPVIKKPCSNNGSDSYSVPKTQSTTYHIDSGPLYQLIPAKEVPNQRNSRTVNWMTEPDNRNRGMLYCSQNEKMPVPKAPIYTQTDNFYPSNQTSKISTDCSLNFVGNDQVKINYQKNDFFGKDQRCKSLEKRNHTKCYPKTSQNNYNIFDYNYAGSCYTEDESNKYWNNGQSFSGKIKKNVQNVGKKKPEGIILAPNEHQPVDSTKRPPEQIITNLDFNPVPNQECFTWMPGKNVEWLPSKSFGLDTNLVVPSTLPTLVGDLALGTTSTNDITLVKTSNSKICQPNLKTLPNDITKDYIDLGVGSTIMSKPMETMDANKQYLEPFANLSKNIFDITPSNAHNPQMPKNDFDKVNFLGSNNNETIILKNIFELPVSKSNGVAGDFNRQKQRNVNSTQNTFLSVSQLVEPPTFEGNNMKSENQLETNGVKPDLYGQNYTNFNNPKTFRGKNRSSHCKYNDRKYQGYKNGSSSYTAEALIRSNNVNCQTNEFAVDINNTNFFNGKTSQKPEQFPANNKTDFEINGKLDYQGPNQNIYTDFNFSSPVPNFTIGSAVSSTDFGNHEANSNFSSQNNTFFSDFITPEYPLSENLPNSLLIPPCSIALQSPFVIDKRNFPVEKSKNNSKQYSTSRNRTQDCSKTSFNDFSVPPSSAIFTTASLTCPTIFTTSACQNLLSVPTQSIPISFSSPSFTNSNISFPPLTTSTNNYHKFPPNPSQNSASGTFLPSNAMFTTCTSKPNSSTHNCYSSNPLTSVTNSVISSPFSVANVPFSTSSQSTIPFFSLSNPIIPSSAPTSSSNSLANFNLSTIFPEINQKGNYHYS